MDSSRGFGSHPRHDAAPLAGGLLALFRLGFPAAPPLWRGLTWRRRCTRRIILQKARHQPYLAHRERESGL